MEILKSFVIVLVITAGVPLAAGSQRIKESLGTDLDEVIPYIATGAGWSTSVTIINAEKTTASVKISLFNGDGEPVSLETAHQGRMGNQSTINIPGYGSATIDFVPTPDYEVNWMALDPSNFITTTAKLRYSQYFDTVQYGNVLLEHQALEVASSEFDGELLGSFDTTNGDDTLYLINPWEFQGDIDVVIHATLAGGGTQVLTITVAPMTRVAVSLQKVFGTTRGWMKITSTGSSLGAIILDLDGSSFSMLPLVRPD